MNRGTHKLTYHAGTWRLISKSQSTIRPQSILRFKLVLGPQDWNQNWSGAVLACLDTSSCTGTIRDYAPRILSGQCFSLKKFSPNLRKASSPSQSLMLYGLRTDLARPSAQSSYHILVQDIQYEAQEGLSLKAA